MTQTNPKTSAQKRPAISPNPRTAGSKDKTSADGELSYDEVSQRLGVGKTRISQLVSEGRLESRRYPRHKWVITLESLLAYEEYLATPLAPLATPSNGPSPNGSASNGSASNVPSGQKPVR